MGLQSQLNDVGSDSIPILLVALIASCVSHLRSLFAAAFHSVRHHQIDAGFLHLSSGLAGLIAISDHRLSLLPFRYSDERESAAADEREGCIFCLSQLKDGDWVHRLPCKHIFHKSCFDGWLDQMKFNCPLCRSPLLSEWRVEDHAAEHRRVASDLAAWFAVR